MAHNTDTVIQDYTTLNYGNKNTGYFICMHDDITGSNDDNNDKVITKNVTS